jgi:hypothetical protein
MVSVYLTGRTRARVGLRTEQIQHTLNYTGGGLHKQRVNT